MFGVTNFTNNRTFYTDSNGLEMQKRIIDYRPTWDITAKDWYQNITANQYPINSAMSMVTVDKTKKFTVMNDRSQAGTALEEGEFQFIQARREFGDDLRGEAIPLNETDKNGHGIRIKATYYLEVSGLTDSRQRQVQQKTDNPLQVFFALNLKSANEQSSACQATNDFASPNVKYVAFPVAKNEILLRLENIGDVYDGAQAQSVDAIKLLTKMFLQANGLMTDCSANADLFAQTRGQTISFDLTEVTLTGNMELSEMRARKIQWKTRDDALGKGV